jgi:YHS domain-containing protein
VNVGNPTIFWIFHTDLAPEFKAMKKTILFILLSIVYTMSTAQTDQERKAHFNIENNIAIQGYDPVVYIKSNKALEGKKELTASYKGINYRFSSKENLELFKQSPNTYEPVYGGWCAYAMGNSGEKVEVDPHTFKLIDGKIYLFYNFYFNNTLKSWNKMEAELKVKADKSWNKIITKK